MVRNFGCSLGAEGVPAATADQVADCVSQGGEVEEQVAEDGGDAVAGAA